MEFIAWITALAVLFLISIFLFYLDSRRSVAPTGTTASIMSSFTKLGWKAEDVKGPRGMVFRQNLLIRLLVAIVITTVFTVLVAIFFGAPPADPEKADPFSGFWPFMIKVGVVILASYTSYLWPKVRAKAEEVGAKIKAEGEKAAADFRKDMQGNGASEKKGPTITPPPVDPDQKARDAKSGIDDYLKS